MPKILCEKTGRIVCIDTSNEKANETQNVRRINTFPLGKYTYQVSTCCVLLFRNRTVFFSVR